MLHGLSLDMKYPVTATAESHGFKRPTIILVVQIRGANLAALGTPVGPHNLARGNRPANSTFGLDPVRMNLLISSLDRLHVFKVCRTPTSSNAALAHPAPRPKATPISRIALEELDRLGVVSMTLRTRS